jgi:hypothetical protein|tara:strand:- start:3119 stop:3655 length:537 start_codon:yes stop_codon:yes gene_type:complete
MIKIVDNFLDFPEEYYRLCKELKFYNKEDFVKVTNYENNFPGLRTNYLDKDYPFLYYSVLAYIKHKFELDLSVYKRICGHGQIRFNDSKDWIHKDIGDTVIIYLSPTNDKSGTAFYDIVGDDGKEWVYKQTAMVNFINNRGIFFTHGTWHQAINNHGVDKEDGRLTLTYFLQREPFKY